MRNFLRFRQPDLAFKMIHAAGLSIGPGEVVSALQNSSPAVLTKLCKVAAELPKQVTFTEAFIEGEFSNLLEQYDSAFYGISREDFVKMKECYKKVAKE